MTTRRQAEHVLAAVRKAFPAYSEYVGDYGPKLVTEWAWAGNPAPYAVVWEEGPYDWAYLFTAGGVDEEMAVLAAEFGAKPRPVKPYRAPKVYVEPMTAWAVGIYGEA